MADSFVQANPGSGGAKFVVDIDGSGNAWPETKVAFGLSGTQTEVADQTGNRLPVKNIGPRGSLVNHGGTITTGGTTQQLLASNASRNFVMIWNPPASGANLWINFGSAATQDQNSYEIAPGGIFYQDGSGFVTTDAINIIGPTTGQVFGCKEG
jgi:hypothetical protein